MLPQRLLLIGTGFLLLILLAIFITPLAFIFWIGWGLNFSYRLSLPVFPGAEQVNHAYGYYGASSGLEAVYFWTSEDIEEVLAYYEGFSLPFQPDPHNGWPITAFRTRSSDLKYRDIAGVEHNVDGVTEIYCHYTQRYKCVNVRLVDINTDETIRVVPDVVGASASSADNATPFPLESALTQGTLIIYTYYVFDP